MALDKLVRSTSPVAIPKWHSRPFGRLAIGALILLAEYLVLTVTFDAKDVLARGGVWTVLGRAGNLGSVVIAGTAAFLLVPRLHKGVDPSITSPGRASAWVLLLHTLFAAAFTYVTSVTFRSQAPTGAPALWVLLWTILGTGVALSLLMAIVGNWRWLFRTLARIAALGSIFGILSLIVGTLTSKLWPPLARATFFVVAALFKSFGLEMDVNPAALTIDLEGFAVEIAPMCSGLEGIGLYVVLMSGFLYQLRERFRFPRAFLLLPLGVVLVWFGNALRIAALMLVGSRVDPDIAQGSFHSKAGWVFFAIITLSIAAAARKSSFFARLESRQADQTSENMAAPLIVPLLVWISVGLVTSLFNDHHDPLYGVRVAVTGGVLWTFRAKIRQWYQAPTIPAIVTGLLIGVAWVAIPLAAPRDASNVLLKSWGVLAYVGWIVLRCLGAVVVVPICEELTFRGYAARRLTRAEFWTLPFNQLSWLGIVGSAAVFGAIHERWVLGAVTGVVYAWLVRRSGRLADGIVAHALSNAVIAVWVLTTGDWRHW